MTRFDVLSIAKPTLFNTEMVRAILDDRKTETRRAIKVNLREDEIGWSIIIDAHTGEFCYIEVFDEWDETRRLTHPYAPGDYLYVRETWRPFSAWRGSYSGCEIEYRAGGKKRFNDVLFVPKTDEPWHPSIHMPKKIARIFLHVTGERVERLQDITEEGAKAEGISEEWARSWWKPTFYDPDSGGDPRYRHVFANELWNSTIKPKDLPLYGFAANPWVWVYKFERVEVH